MDYRHDTPTLPGFDPAATSGRDSGLREAALRTVEALQADGLLSGRHALTAQLLVATAERAGYGLNEGKTSIATTNLLRLLAELVDKLPDDGVVSDGAADFLAAVEAATREALTR